MTTIQQKDCQCSLCGTVNQCGVLTSTNNFGGLDTEFRTHAVGWDPLNIYVATCSGCGYTAYDLAKALPPIVVPKVKETVAKFFASEKLDRADVPTYKQYELLACILKVKGNATEDVAEAFLRAAWMADDDDQKLMARYYRKKAAELLEEQLPTEQDESTQAEQQFRLSEIYRRCGEFASAISTQEKIVKDRLHPDLQRAMIKLRAVLEKKDDKIMKFADLLG